MNFNILNELLYIILTILASSLSEPEYKFVEADSILYYESDLHLEESEYDLYYDIDNDFIESDSDLYHDVRKGAIDWFEEVQFLFPRDSNATVLDVETGKSFRVKRTFGTNHADVEPLTSEDSQTIKEIWGGSWNWQRRPVVVKPDLGGHILAGSMTGYPHAGLNDYPALQVVDNRSGNYGRGQNFDAVKGNNVDGHFDIHFLNSRTHSTNTMQGEHQNAVTTAAAFIEANY